MIKLALIVGVLLIPAISAQQRDSPKLTGPYLGQKPPGMTPEPFASGIIPSTRYHTTPVFTPDGTEVYWKMQGIKTICMMKSENGIWSEPREISLSSKLDDFRDPAIAPDGNKMFFLSKGKFTYQSEAKENIWFVERTKNGWSEPQPLNREINSHALHWQVSVASNGNLYFTSRNSGIEDIYCSKYIEGNYQMPEKLNGYVNTEKLCETTPYISPDERYIIFSRWDYYAQDEGMHLYISFRDYGGSWKVSHKLNIEGRCPQVSLDKKYLFYLDSSESLPFWVSAKIIEELRPKE